MERRHIRRRRTETTRPHPPHRPGRRHRRRRRFICRAQHRLHLQHAARKNQGRRRHWIAGRLPPLRPQRRRRFQHGHGPLAARHRQRHGHHRPPRLLRHGQEPSLLPRRRQDPPALAHSRLRAPRPSRLHHDHDRHAVPRLARLYRIHAQLLRRPLGRLALRLPPPPRLA